MSRGQKRLGSPSRRYCVRRIGSHEPCPGGGAGLHQSGPITSHCGEAASKKLRRPVFPYRTPLERKTRLKGDDATLKDDATWLLSHDRLTKPSPNLPWSPHRGSPVRRLYTRLEPRFHCLSCRPSGCCWLQAHGCGILHGGETGGSKGRLPEERRHHDWCQRCIRLRRQLRSLPGD